MASRREPRLADAAEIAAEHGLTPARISQFSTARTQNAAGTAFPEPVGKRGRARLWDHAEVTAWFAHRAPARLTEHTPPLLDPETLLNAADASRYLGYKNTNQVSTFVRDHPGYFPEPDVVEEMGTAESPYRRQLWKVATLKEWMATRPGRGRRAGTKPAPPLPDVPADGDPDELLGASQAAALLGYKSINSFSSALAQGNLPLLKTTDGIAANAGRQNGRRRWTRRRILQQAAQRSSGTRR
ncbi:hypothetical protein BN159_8475 [Streptomyces davaonensis JCM 4913]|uniref:Uncharacterized protein n=1 Tax=Streptomyces davaonensis (strain DSM 101723 / JCM 4913 / KCC S-0913 / 768) TaxID=1214101 RepID=K4QVK9_STRDJ|nr:hypothetical protein [Streptomyces davaonensis]CCK24409.1 hypothetical protein BN159_0030 [Streptomyces davaonensis JCM 4913]CCK32853.1 hypothetical protein BN159_8475 [Streptomyces davaonensis JCM 4913]